MEPRIPDFTTEFGANAPFVADLFTRWFDDPRAVSEDWRDFFATLDPERARVHAESNGRPAASSARDAAVKANGSGAASAPPEKTSSEPLRGIAAKIVRNMEESLGIPTATSVRTISVKLLEENRHVLNRHLGVAGRGKASFTHII